MIRNKDVQVNAITAPLICRSLTDYAVLKIRIARFLESKDDVRERMMDEFKWVWRQVMPLVGEFARAVSMPPDTSSCPRSRPCCSPLVTGVVQGRDQNPIAGHCSPGPSQGETRPAAYGYGVITATYAFSFFIPALMWHGGLHHCINISTHHLAVSYGTQYPSRNTARTRRRAMLSGILLSLQQGGIAWELRA